MIYLAKELNAKLTHLTLSGIEDGYLEFIGKREQWEAAELMEWSEEEEDFDDPHMDLQRDFFRHHGDDFRNRNQD